MNALPRPHPHASRALLALALALLAFLALPTAAHAQAVEIENEVFEIARMLRCPTCVSENVSDSSATVSIEMRNIIREQLQEGRSRDEILAFFQASYGDWILLEPPRRGIYLLVWIAPVLGAMMSLGALVFFFRRWTAASRAPIEVDAADLERVRRSLEGDRS